ncbi:uncharacterized protein [Chiloscyllium punctatum]|uniref:uncharacterized protein isoform X2 n=1 Tax=Chiloscyllium punctatum TaxID=137246 RepID=UPI003B641381
MPSDEEHDMDNSEINDQPISDKQLMELAGKLGSTWQSLAIQHLGFKAYEVENFVSDGNSNRDKAFKMLQSWKCREKCPTVGDLIHILDKADIATDAWLFLCNKGSKYNGFAIDDMLPIIKKPKQFQNIDYLCIDIKNDPWTTLSDLKREFVKRRHRKLHEFQRKVLKGEPMSKSDYSLNIMLIDNVLNKPDGKCGKKFKKDTDKELPGKEVKKVIQNTNCQEKKSQKSEKSKILEKEKITKPFEGLKTSEIQLERREEFKNLGKKKRKIKAAEMDMKIEEGGGLRKETYNLEPSTEKVHTLDHQVKLETGLDDEPVLKQSKITDYKKELTEEKGPQKPPPSTMKERKVTKRKLQGGRNSNKKGQQKMTFEVVSFSKLRYKPKKCYGCGKDIRDVADSDLILKTQGVREYYSGCRQRHLAFHKSNVYFHFLEKCVRKKYGLINRYTFDVPNDISGCLTGAQHAMLRSMENIQDVGDTRFQSKMGRNDLEPY